MRFYRKDEDRLRDLRWRCALGTPHAKQQEKVYELLKEWFKEKREEKVPMCFLIAYANMPYRQCGAGKEDACLQLTVLSLLYKDRKVTSIRVTPEGELR